MLIKGRFVGPPLLQGPQTRDGVPGYHLIQQFDRSDSGGSTILVNRGFIKTAEGDAIRTGAKPIPGMGPNGSPSDIVVVEGLLTKADPNAKSYFTPENKPDENRWYWKDVPAMAEDVGGAAANVQPVLIDAIDREFANQYSSNSRQATRPRPPCSCARASPSAARPRSSCVTST